MDKRLVEYVMGEAAKSNIEKRQVGALIVAHHEDDTWSIVGRGYNIEDTHAEALACEDLFNSEYVKPETSTLTCYVTHPPCPNCATLLAEHGVSNTEVVDAFMKFDGDKPRYDLVDPVFITCCYDTVSNTPFSAAEQSMHDFLFDLRHWQRESTNKRFLLNNLLRCYGGSLLKLEDDLADVLTFGARKYKPNNWRNCQDTGRYLAAAIRHGRAIMRGEDNDSESGLSHKAHLATNIMFLFCLGYK